MSQQIKLTNALLKNFYLEFNRKWFGNKLPKDLPVFFGQLGTTEMGITCFSGASKTLALPEYIQIQKNLGWMSLIKTTLLHEMVHVKLPATASHGPEFLKEMRRLARIGAFDKLW